MRKFIGYGVLLIFSIVYTLYRLFERTFLYNIRKVIVYRDNYGHYHYVRGWKYLVILNQSGDVDLRYTPTEMTLKEFDQLGGSEK